MQNNLVCPRTLRIFAVSSGEDSHKVSLVSSIDRFFKVKIRIMLLRFEISRECWYQSC
jgi:hypothetical protein